jgi:hypothetical protein
MLSAMEGLVDLGFKRRWATADWGAPALLVTTTVSVVEVAGFFVDK